MTAGEVFILHSRSHDTQTDLLRALQEALGECQRLAGVNEKVANERDVLKLEVEKLQQALTKQANGSVTPPFDGGDSP